MQMELVPHPEIVSDAGVYVAPTCQVCGQPFAYWRGEGNHEDWKQTCDCPSTSGCFVDGRMQATRYFNGAWIGRPRYHWCILCRSNLATGEQAMSGQMGPYGYIGYAHIACYEVEVRRVDQAYADAQAAGRGVLVSVWYGPGEHIRPAPSTGHSDGEARAIPSCLPELPAGVVAYDVFRRPFALVRLAFPDPAAASAWWQQTTAAAEAALELYWFEPGAEKPSREWRGRGFSIVESRAKIAELMAE